jgi:hypothetical protein
MPRKTKVLLPFLLLFGFGSAVDAQQTQSLGDIARRLRAEKNHAATSSSAPAATTPATPSSAASLPASPEKPKTAAGTIVDPAIARETEQETKAQKSELNLPPGIGIEGMLHFVDGNSEQIRELFEQDKFETIDTIADRARSTKKRFVGGFWYLHAIYRGLEEPRQGTTHSGKAEWQQHIDRLKRWVAQRPNSVTARIALADSYIGYAWNGRGSGTSDSVSEDGWQVFHDRLELAGQTLKDAYDLPTKDPEWYLVMLGLVRDLGGSKEMMAATFDKAFAFEPDYYYYYQVTAESLEEKWLGEKGDLAAFAEKAADRRGGDQGDMVYYEIARQVNCNCGEDQDLHGLSFTRIKRGYIALEKQYGVSLDQLNKIAYLAAVGGDPLYANEIFGRMQDNWDPDTWKSQSYFETAKAWAKEGEHINLIKDAIKSADENVKTPAGQKFQGELEKSFQASYGAAAVDCKNKSGDAILFPFDMMLQLGQDGAVQELYTSLRSGVTACLTPQVRRGHFPAPPQPSYWVKVHLQPTPEDIQKLKAAGIIH